MREKYSFMCDKKHFNLENSVHLAKNQSNKKLGLQVAERYRLVVSLRLS